VALGAVRAEPERGRSLRATSLEATSGAPWIPAGTPLSNGFGKRTVGLQDVARESRHESVGEPRESRNPYVNLRCLPLSASAALSRARLHSGHGGRSLVSRWYVSLDAAMGWPQKVNTLRGRILWRVLVCVFRFMLWHSSFLPGNRFAQ
jgi:hypothetical protein